MLDAVRNTGGRPGRCRCCLAVAALPAMVLWGTIGCARNGELSVLETGYSDQSKTQILFYSPPGATVTVRGSTTRGHQIAASGPEGHRLEYSPEEFSVFNLSPGRYEFKYVTAPGLPGVSVYGELNVGRPCSHEARVFQRRAFVPVALPSLYYQRVEHIGDEIFPFRGQAMRRAIDEHDLERLKQGDVIEKVFFIADLERARKQRDLIDQEIAVCEREIEYADDRFRLAYLDSKLDITDSLANLLGTDREHIRWERRRIALHQKLIRLQELRDRTHALLKGDRVLTRKGMLVLATEQVIESHRDPVRAADDLGEVILVMRIGGRHMHWGDPRSERAAYEY